MAAVAIVIGLALGVLGIGGYLATDRVSQTALIPAYFGAALVVLGAVALAPGARKHAMHLAAAWGLAGLLAGLGRFVVLAARGADLTKPGPLSTLGMAVLCGTFVALCVRSFIRARQAQRAKAASAASVPT